MTAAKPYLVVVGIDYSEPSRMALREALKLAALKESSVVHALHVEANMSWFPRVEFGTKFSASAILSEAFPRLEQLVNDELLAFREQQRQAGVWSTLVRVLSHIRTESPAREIAQLATDLEADLVVVGTHGRTGLARLILGSVAQGVVSLCQCPVLVVKPKYVLPAGPAIEPPCAACLAARTQAGSGELWCALHREQHGQRRHTYFQDDRAATETNFPLVFDER